MISDIVGSIGNTPLIQLKNIIKPETGGRILLKYERTNPSGSVKDRPAAYIISEAEKRGLISPEGTIIESSSGNFGISLAMISAAHGYHAIILVDPKTTESNLALLKSFGAEVVVVTDKDDSGSYHKTRIKLANELAKKIPNSFRPDQCFNLLNSEAHYRSTANEILNECEGSLAAVIAAVSTGGQLGGVSRRVKEVLPYVKMVGVDAVGSSIFGGEAHSYETPGMGLGWTPNNIRLDFVDTVYKITDAEAFETARCVAKNEGILIGPSGGACVLTALSMAKTISPEKSIVCIIPDCGERYIQTLCNDKWMKEQGFRSNIDINTLRDMANNLQPWSTNPTAVSNYRPDLFETLEVPNSTIEFNKEFE